MNEREVDRCKKNHEEQRTTESPRHRAGSLKGTHEVVRCRTHARTRRRQEERNGREPQRRAGDSAPCLVALAIVFFTCGTAWGKVELSAKGKSEARIVIATNAIPSERYAAEELQGYLEKISGVKLPITTDDAKPGSRDVLLGDNAHLAKLKLGLDLKGLGTDGFELRTSGKRLIIAGGRPRGTLYGVYTLLEENLGVRWFTSDLEVVPKTNRVVLPDLNTRKVPALEYREVFWTEMMRDANLAARHRLNGNHYSLGEKHGGRFVVYFPFVHSFDMLIPPDLYKEHSNYFPMIKGQRVSGYVQRCLSNPEALQLAKGRVRQWLKEHPEATIISVSQNDTGNWCQCEDCKKLDDAEGTPAASLLRFVNAIAEDIEHDYPRVRIDTLAYQYTRKPPRTLRPRANVVIRLCSIECCFAHPLATCTAAENDRFKQDILAWQPVAPLLYVWDYTPNFAHYQQPFPNFAALQPNVQFFVQHGVKGLFEQGNYSGGGFGEMGPLRAYVLAKLLWDPETDMSRHVDEFLKAYYGQAAPGIAEYMRVVQSQVEKPKVHAHIFDSPQASYLNETFLTTADQVLNEAEAKAENDKVKFRVQVVRLPVWYVQMVTGRVTGETRTALLKRFLEVAHKAGISNISEGQGLEDWAKKMGG